MTRIDLNSDLGESYGQWRLGDDETMLSLVTSANIACGFHAGDPATLLETCRGAAKHNVRIGAQVAYHDLMGFGRRFIDVEQSELTAEVIYQIGALDGLAKAVGSAVSYVKPHGALYNTIVHHREQARAVVAAIRSYDASLPVLGLPGSAFLDEAERAGLTVVTEAFADRAYTPAGTLVSRREPDAVLHDPDVVAQRVLRMVTDGVVTAIDGTDVRVNPQSVCIHGDSPDATAMAVAVRAILDAENVGIHAFV